jgi:two-component system sensor histidine kinase TtrS
VPQAEFRFVPVTLLSVEALLENGELNFLVTNPGHFVTLESRFPMSVLATRRRALPDGREVTEFGSVIFARAGAGIGVLQDVVDRDVIAVDQAAFGGFQMAWREFNAHGIDPFSDFASLTFAGFPQDEIVTRVLDGEADVGVVRSGLLEALESEQGLDLARIHVLNDNASFTHPERVSTRLYPEWPFLALASTPAPLRDAVALALLSSQTPGVAERYGLFERWSAPVTYLAARELVAAYDQARPGETGETGGQPGWIVWTFAFVAAAIALLWIRRAPVTDHPVAAADTDAGAGAATGPEIDLTPREEEILVLIQEGFSTKEIAQRLDISPKTVEFHRSNLLKKYGARSSLHLVKVAKTPET